jgi:hypothetical protein
MNDLVGVEKETVLGLVWRNEENYEKKLRREVSPDRDPNRVPHEQK